MQVQSSVSEDGKEAKIVVDGKFDFASMQMFRKAYMELEKNLKSYIIDFKQTEYVDSSALGMILSFREYLGGDGVSIQIINCSEDIKKIFAITKLNKVFIIQ